MSLTTLENLNEPFTIDTTPTPPTSKSLPPIITNNLGTDNRTSAVIIASAAKDLDISRSSDSGKSSSCSPTLLDCSFDSGIAGVLLDSNDMQLHKRIQQCQRILLALERDREHFCTIRNRLSKITDRKKKQSTDSEYFCNVCCAEIDPEDAKTFVKCFICQKHICRSIKCADWLAKTAQWECELCQTSKESMAQTSSWVAEQISFNQEKLVYPMRARSEIFIPISECNDSSIHFESVSQIGANSALITAEQKLKIREYVEEVVANLLGGNLDTISVNQLSKSENYLPAPKTNGHQHQNGSIITYNSETSREVTPISANGPDFTDISETRLRQMIQKIIAETINIPLLSTKHAVSEIALDRRSKTADNMPLTNGHRHRTEHYFEPNIYQDLLATAVLNKIVDKQLNNNTMSESSPDLTHEDSGGIGGERHVGLDQNFNIENQSTTSGSSIEPRSDCSYTDMEQRLNINDKSAELIIDAGRESVMSDYLASHMVPLPDLSTMATESEEDDYMSVTSSAVGDGNWENNWLFKKKKPTIGGPGAAASIGMLVPDPKEDVRAQIGDKTADEISDLSELGSDTDDSLDILRSKLDPINDRLMNKHLIGGQNNKLVLDELIERSSMISNTLPTDLEHAYTETCNEHIIDAPTKTEAINVDVNQQNNNTMEQEDSKVILPPTGFEDLSSNPLTASDEFSESDGCTGFSSVEILEPTMRIPSVVEILAAIALGPMLAISAVDQPATLTNSELDTLNELKDLALAEIKVRSLELTPHSLSVIPEEPAEQCIDLKKFPTPDEQIEGIINDFEKSLINTIDFSNLETDCEISETEADIHSTPETAQTTLECQELNSESINKFISAESTAEIKNNIKAAEYSEEIKETIDCVESIIVTEETEKPILDIISNDKILELVIQPLIENTESIPELSVEPSIVEPSIELLQAQSEEKISPIMPAELSLVPPESKLPESPAQPSDEEFFKLNETSAQQNMNEQFKDKSNFERKDTDLTEGIIIPASTIKKTIIEEISVVEASKIISIMEPSKESDASIYIEINESTDTNQYLKDTVNEVSSNTTSESLIPTIEQVLQDAEESTPKATDEQISQTVHLVSSEPIPQPKIDHFSTVKVENMSEVAKLEFIKTEKSNDLAKDEIYKTAVSEGFKCDTQPMEENIFPQHSGKATETHQKSVENETLPSEKSSPSQAEDFYETASSEGSELQSIEEAGVHFEISDCTIQPNKQSIKFQINDTVSETAFTEVPDVKCTDKLSAAKNRVPIEHIDTTFEPVNERPCLQYTIQDCDNIPETDALECVISNFEEPLQSSSASHIEKQDFDTTPDTHRTGEPTEAEIQDTTFENETVLDSASVVHRIEESMSVTSQEKIVENKHSEHCDGTEELDENKITETGSQGILECITQYESTPVLTGEQTPGTIHSQSSKCDIQQIETSTTVIESINSDTAKSVESDSIIELTEGSVIVLSTILETAQYTEKSVVAETENKILATETTDGDICETTYSKIQLTEEYTANNILEPSSDDSVVSIKQPIECHTEKSLAAPKNDGNKITERADVQQLDYSKSDAREQNVNVAQSDNKLSETTATDGKIIESVTSPQTPEEYISLKINDDILSETQIIFTTEIKEKKLEFFDAKETITKITEESNKDLSVTFKDSQILEIASSECLTPDEAPAKVQVENKIFEGLESIKLPTEVLIPALTTDKNYEELPSQCSNSNIQNTEELVVELTANDVYETAEPESPKTLLLEESVSVTIDDTIKTSDTTPETTLLECLKCDAQLKAESEFSKTDKIDLETKFTIIVESSKQFTKKALPVLENTNFEFSETQLTDNLDLKLIENEISKSGPSEDLKPIEETPSELTGDNCETDTLECTESARQPTGQFPVVQTEILQTKSLDNIDDTTQVKEEHTTKTVSQSISEIENVTQTTEILDGAESVTQLTGKSIMLPKNEKIFEIKTSKCTQSDSEATIESTLEATENKNFESEGIQDTDKTIVGNTSETFNLACLKPHTLSAEQLTAEKTENQNIVVTPSDSTESNKQIGEESSPNSIAENMVGESKLLTEKVELKTSPKDTQSIEVSIPEPTGDNISEGAATECLNSNRESTAQLTVAQTETVSSDSVKSISQLSQESFPDTIAETVSSEVKCDAQIIVNSETLEIVSETTSSDGMDRAESITQSIEKSILAQNNENVSENVNSICSKSQTDTTEEFKLESPKNKISDESTLEFSQETEPVQTETECSVFLSQLTEQCIKPSNESKCKSQTLKCLKCENETSDKSAVEQTDDKIFESVSPEMSVPTDAKSNETSTLERSTQEKIILSEENNKPQTETKVTTNLNDIENISLVTEESILETIPETTSLEYMKCDAESTTQLSKNSFGEPTNENVFEQSKSDIEASHESEGEPTENKICESTTMPVQIKIACLECVESIPQPTEQLNEKVCEDIISECLKPENETTDESVVQLTENKISKSQSTEIQNTAEQTIPAPTDTNTKIADSECLILEEITVKKIKHITEETSDKTIPLLTDTNSTETVTSEYSVQEMTALLLTENKIIETLTSDAIDPIESEESTPETIAETNLESTKCGVESTLQPDEKCVEAMQTETVCLDYTEFAPQPTVKLIVLTNESAKSEKETSNESAEDKIFESASTEKTIQPPIDANIIENATIECSILDEITVPQENKSSNEPAEEITEDKIFVSASTEKTIQTPIDDNVIESATIECIILDEITVSQSENKIKEPSTSDCVQPNIPNTDDYSPEATTECLKCDAESTSQNTKNSFEVLTNVNSEGSIFIENRITETVTSKVPNLNIPAISQSTDQLEKETTIESAVELRTQSASQGVPHPNELTVTSEDNINKSVNSDCLIQDEITPEEINLQEKCTIPQTENHILDAEIPEAIETETTTLEYSKCDTLQTGESVLIEKGFVESPSEEPIEKSFEAQTSKNVSENVTSKSETEDTEELPVTPSENKVSEIKTPIVPQLNEQITDVPTNENLLENSNLQKKSTEICIVAENNKTVSENVPLQSLEDSPAETNKESVVEQKCEMISNSVAPNSSQSEPMNILECVKKTNEEAFIVITASKNLESTPSEFLKLEIHQTDLLSIDKADNEMDKSDVEEFSENKMAETVPQNGSKSCGLNAEQSTSNNISESASSEIQPTVQHTQNLDGLHPTAEIISVHAETENSNSVKILTNKEINDISVALDDLEPITKLTIESTQSTISIKAEQTDKCLKSVKPSTLEISVEKTEITHSDFLDPTKDYISESKYETVFEIAGSEKQSAETTISVIKPSDNPESIAHSTVKLISVQNNKNEQPISDIRSTKELTITPAENAIIETVPLESVSSTTEEASTTIAENIILKTVPLEVLQLTTGEDTVKPEENIIIIETVPLEGKQSATKELIIASTESTIIENASLEGTQTATKESTLESAERTITVTVPLEGTQSTTEESNIATADNIILETAPLESKSFTTKKSAYAPSENILEAVSLEGTQSTIEESTTVTMEGIPSFLELSTIPTLENTSIETGSSEDKQSTIKESNIAKAENTKIETITLECGKSNTAISNIAPAKNVKEEETAVAPAERTIIETTVPVECTQSTTEDSNISTAEKTILETGTLQNTSSAKEESITASAEKTISETAERTIIETTVPVECTQSTAEDSNISTAEKPILETGTLQNASSAKEESITASAENTISETDSLGGIHSTAEVSYIALVGSITTETEPLEGTQSTTKESTIAPVENTVSETDPLEGKQSAAEDLNIAQVENTILETEALVGTQSTTNESSIAPADNTIIEGIILKIVPLESTSSSTEECTALSTENDILETVSLRVTLSTTEESTIAPSEKIFTETGPLEDIQSYSEISTVAPAENEILETLSLESTLSPAKEFTIAPAEIIIIENEPSGGSQSTTEDSTISTAENIILETAPLESTSFNTEESTTGPGENKILETVSLDCTQYTTEESIRAPAENTTTKNVTLEDIQPNPEVSTMSLVENTMTEIDSSEGTQSGTKECTVEIAANTKNTEISTIGTAENDIIETLPLEFKGTQDEPYSAPENSLITETLPLKGSQSTTNESSIAPADNTIIESTIMETVPLESALSSTEESTTAPTKHNILETVSLRIALSTTEESTIAPAKNEILETLPLEDTLSPAEELTIAPKENIITETKPSGETQSSTEDCTISTAANIILETVPLETKTFTIEESTTAPAENKILETVSLECTQSTTEESICAPAENTITKNVTLEDIQPNLELSTISLVENTITEIESSEGTQSATKECTVETAENTNNNTTEISTIAPAENKVLETLPLEDSQSITNESSIAPTDNTRIEDTNTLLPTEELNIAPTENNIIQTEPLGGTQSTIEDSTISTLENIILQTAPLESTSSRTEESATASAENEIIETVSLECTQSTTEESICAPAENTITENVTLEATQPNVEVSISLVENTITEIESSEGTQSATKECTVETAENTNNNTTEISTIAPAENKVLETQPIKFEGTQYTDEPTTALVDSLITETVITNESSIAPADNTRIEGTNTLLPTEEITIAPTENNIIQTEPLGGTQSTIEDSTISTLENIILQTAPLESTSSRTEESATASAENEIIETVSLECTQSTTEESICAPAENTITENVTLEATHPNVEVSISLVENTITEIESSEGTQSATKECTVETAENTSNNTTEISTIAQAENEILETQPSKCKVTQHTDEPTTAPEDNLITETVPLEGSQYTTEESTIAKAENTTLKALPLESSSSTTEEAITASAKNTISKTVSFEGTQLNTEESTCAPAENTINKTDRLECTQSTLEVSTIASVENIILETARVLATSSSVEESTIASAENTIIETVPLEGTKSTTEESSISLAENTTLEIDSLDGTTKESTFVTAESSILETDPLESTQSIQQFSTIASVENATTETNSSECSQSTTKEHTLETKTISETTALEVTQHTTEELTSAPTKNTSTQIVSFEDKQSATEESVIAPAENTIMETVESTLVESTSSTKEESTTSPTENIILETHSLEGSQSTIEESTFSPVENTITKTGLLDGTQSTLKVSTIALVKNAIIESSEDTQSTTKGSNIAQRENTIKETITLDCSQSTTATPTIAPAENEIFETLPLEGTLSPTEKFTIAPAENTIKETVPLLGIQSTAEPITVAAANVPIESTSSSTEESTTAPSDITILETVSFESTQYTTEESTCALTENITTGTGTLEGPISTLEVSSIAPVENTIKENETPEGAQPITKESMITTPANTIIETILECTKSTTEISTIAPAENEILETLPLQLEGTQSTTDEPSTAPADSLITEILPLEGTQFTTPLADSLITENTLLEESTIATANNTILESTSCTTKESTIAPAENTIVEKNVNEIDTLKGTESATSTIAPIKNTIIETKSSEGTQPTTKEFTFATAEDTIIETITLEYSQPTTEISSIAPAENEILETPILRFEGTQSSTDDCSADCSITRTLPLESTSSTTEESNIAPAENTILETVSLEGAQFTTEESTGENTINESGTLKDAHSTLDVENSIIETELSESTQSAENTIIGTITLESTQSTTELTTENKILETPLDGKQSTEVATSAPEEIAILEIIGLENTQPTTQESTTEPAENAVLETVPLEDTQTTTKGTTIIPLENKIKETILESTQSTTEESLNAQGENINLVAVALEITQSTTEESTIAPEENIIIESAPLEGTESTREISINVPLQSSQSTTEQTSTAEAEITILETIAPENTQFITQESTTTPAENTILETDSFKSTQTATKESTITPVENTFIKTVQFEGTQSTVEESRTALAENTITESVVLAGTQSSTEESTILNIIQLEGTQSTTLPAENTILETASLEVTQSTTGECTIAPAENATIETVALEGIQSTTEKSTTSPEENTIIEYVPLEGKHISTEENTTLETPPPEGSQSNTEKSIISQAENTILETVTLDGTKSTTEKPAITPADITTIETVSLEGIESIPQSSNTVQTDDSVSETTTSECLFQNEQSPEMSTKVVEETDFSNNSDTTSAPTTIKIDNQCYDLTRQETAIQSPQFMEDNITQIYIKTDIAPDLTSECLNRIIAIEPQVLQKGYDSEESKEHVVKQIPKPSETSPDETKELNTEIKAAVFIESISSSQQDISSVSEIVSDSVTDSIAQDTPSFSSTQTVPDFCSQSVDIKTAAETSTDLHSESLDIIPINISTDEQVSLDEITSPSITRQHTVVEIEPKESGLDDSNNFTATNAREPITTKTLGNNNVLRKLQRQCRVEDTTPSFEDDSQHPQPPITNNSLASICQKYIHDKHLLAALEKRRRQTLLMHRFLTTIDSYHSTDASTEETTEFVTEVQQIPIVDRPPLPVVCEISPHNHDSDDDNDPSDSFSFKVNAKDTKISFNFINNVLFSDQLSYDCTHNGDSRTDTVEEYIENDNDEKDILVNKFKTTTPTTTTNINLNTNTSSITNDNYPLIGINGTTVTTKQSNISQLTSAVQNQRSHPSSTFVQLLHKNKNNPNTYQKTVEEHVSNRLVKESTNSIDDDNDDGGDGFEVEILIEEDDEEEDDDDEVAMLRHFVPGSIAEREYKKWNNAVEMPNNPYAPEALKRRISGSQERFIDLPNISPAKDQNPLELLNKDNLDVDETDKRQSDYRRYSRDYYINNGSSSSQASPVREIAATPTKDTPEAINASLQTTANETEIDLYKAIPAQVVEDTTSSIDTSSQKSIQSANTTTSDDSDTIKIYDFKKQETTILREAKTQMQEEGEESAKAEVKAKERPTALTFSRSESGGNVTTPTRGSTPTAFKFLQPKRKLLDPSQVLSVDEDESPVVTSPIEKPVIEKEVAQALPSVKALARAFLMTSNTSQPAKCWLRKTKTLSQGEKRPLGSPIKSLDPSHLQAVKVEEDLTITSDLSSLETDSTSVDKETENTKDILEKSSPPEDDTTASGTKSSVPARQCDLKSNIAFFENLKFK